AQAAARVGAALVHVSAIGADPASGSAYARSKAEGEAKVFSACPEAVVFRPSLVFGPGDSFFNRFANLARALPVLPLAGAKSRFQPVFVGDVAEAIALATEGRVPGGKVYELGGPEVATLEHLVRYMLETTHRKRVVLDLPLPLAKLQARAMEIADTLTFGFLPADLKLTRDQVVLLQSDNVVSEYAKSEGRTLEALGILPTAAEAVVPGYLWRFRKAGQFATGRGTPGMAEIPDSIAPEPMGPGSQHRPMTASGPAIGADAASSSRMGARWGTRR
ncbi:sugar nucleotide-binding protein, partial [Methylobacterium trifolii]